MEIVGIIIGFGALLLGAFAMRTVLLLRSTIDRDRASVAQSLQRLRAALETAFDRINKDAAQLTAIGAELAAVGETSLLAQRRINEQAARLTAIGGELAAVADTSRRGAAAVGDPRPKRLEGVEVEPASAPYDDDGKVVPFRKEPKKEVSRAPEPIEDPPPSGVSERVETLADVIRLIAHTVPTGPRDAAVRVIASMFRENPKADMDTDSGPMWIDTISHFLPANPHATMTEIAAEYNRRAEEHNRRLDEEER